MGGMSNASRLVYLFLFLNIYYFLALVLYSDPIRSHRLHRAGFGQCSRAGPLRDVLAHGCAAGNGFAGATFLTGRICEMEVLLNSGN